MAVGRRFTGPKAGGAISMSFVADREFGSDDDALLERLASMLPDAFARARASDRERTSSLTLQESLLPTDRLIGFDGWQRATRYQPASDEARIGGDWFDLFEVGPDRIAIAVGDIVGQGIQAAAVMGQMRSALRALARASDGPEHALAELDRFSREVEGAFASTVVLAVIDTRERLVEVATAGHPPPLLATADGVIVVSGAHGAPIGVSTESRRTATTVRLDDEQTILFYTDGLIERRGESIDQGLDRLVHVIDEHRDEPVLRLVDLAIEGSADPRRGDDIAVVALRPVGIRPRTFSASILSTPASIRSTRHDLRRWFEALGIDDVKIADLLLAASEAMTNAMDHAYQGAADGEILVTGSARDDRVEVTVRDFGRWAPTVRSSVRGRGLAIIGAVTDESRIDPTPDGMEVRLVAVLDEPIATDDATARS
jgi:anti-sigma regulatory factor (Ser/Thr protein kinase)